MTYLIIFMCWALFTACVIAHYYWFALRKERKQWEEKWANRTVGSIVSSTETERGIEVDIEITDQDTWDKINNGGLRGVSIGPMSVDEWQPTHHPEYGPYKGPGTQAWAEEQYRRMKP